VEELLEQANYILKGKADLSASNEKKLVEIDQLIDDLQRLNVSE